MAPSPPVPRPDPHAPVGATAHTVGSYGALVLPSFVMLGIPAALLGVVAAGGQPKIGPEAATLLGGAALAIGAWLLVQALPRRVTLAPAPGGAVAVRTAVGPFGRRRTYPAGTIAAVRIVRSRSANRDGTFNSFFRLELQPAGRPKPAPVPVCRGGASEGDGPEPPAALAALAEDLAGRLGARIERVREED